MFQIHVPDAEINPGDITNHPDNNKKVHFRNKFCTLVYKCVIL